MSRAFGTRGRHCGGWANNASGMNDVNCTNDVYGVLNVITASSVI